MKKNKNKPVLVEKENTFDEISCFAEENEDLELPLRLSEDAKSIQEEQVKKFDLTKPFTVNINIATSGYGEFGSYLDQDAREVTRTPAQTAYIERTADVIHAANTSATIIVIKGAAMEFASSIYYLIIDIIAQELGEELFEDLQNNHYDILDKFQRSLLRNLVEDYVKYNCDQEVFSIMTNYRYAHDNGQLDGKTLSDYTMTYTRLPYTALANYMTCHIANTVFDTLYLISCIYVRQLPDFLDEIGPEVSMVLTNTVTIAYGFIVDISKDLLHNHGVTIE